MAKEGISHKNKEKVGKSFSMFADRTALHDADFEFLVLFCAV
jgi:hypothetical protein